MKNWRTHLAAFAILAAAIGYPAAAAPGAGQCQAFEQMVSVQTNWSPREALRQERLMRTALDSVKAGAPGKRDVYILAAAFGGEHVFDKEANSAATILAKRYGTNRKVVLSNASAMLGENAPAATPEHFSAALARIGEAMDPEDVLFLFITSHGARDKGAVIYEAQRLQSSMSPRRLAAELDDADIKNRVLIVSACFSGYYIPALANADTAILTAASADRSSFGCQPERDWTYFGDALFAHAMAGGAPLMEAFEQAKALIAEWEADLKVAPSQPRADIGVNAKAFLADLERRPAKVAAQQ